MDRFKHPDDPVIVDYDWRGEPLEEGSPVYDIDGELVHEDDIIYFLEEYFGGVKYIFEGGRFE